MPKRAKFTPKKKKTLTPEPNWDKLKKAKTEEEQIAAWMECDAYVHTEVTEREYLHSTKKWIRDRSGWDHGVYEEAIKIPDVFLATIGKSGWKAYLLGYMPEKVKAQFEKQLFDMIEKSDKLREQMFYEPPIHPSIADLDDDHKLHPTKVKQWIEYWKKFVSASKNNDKLTQEQITARTYVYNMQTYLKSGVWLDSHYGERRENKIVPVCIAPAYDKDGCIVRTKGTYYRDIGAVWGEME